jgi:dihydrolipoamide dehydrogenase
VSTKAVVIGAGPAGYVCAIRLAQLGVETTIIEKEGRLGGTCLNWGCIPSKAYISAAKLWEQLQDAARIGISVENPRVDLARMRAWKDGIVQRLSGGITELMKRHNVQVRAGTASFTARDRVELREAGGSRAELTADVFVVATGSRSIDIPGFPVDEKSVLSSTGALDLDAVPGSLLVIGGGVIGLEIGQYLGAFGTRLTVIELMDQLLPGTDPDLVRIVARNLKKAGATVHLRSKATSLRRTPEGLEVGIEGQDGKTTKAVVEKVLVAVGRKPNSEGLGLDLAGVELTPRGFVKVDRQLRTTNPKVFAIGDLAGPPLLAHKGSKEGLVAAAVIAGRKEAFDARAIPAAIFTNPEIASVGLTETEARAQGLAVRTGTFPFAASGRALAGRETDGLVRIVAEAGTDRLLGVHIAGPHASELIAEGALALEAGLAAEDLALTVHTHPTLAETLMEAAEDVHGLAIHIYNPKR